ncbi:MAG TPA: HYR domain-containing protein [Xanthomonadaceae bacterium]|nr:HYR domain-containing protein [Xanthomonadaceae bacterium]
MDDGRGGTATDTVVVRVVDTTPPVLNLPADISTDATDASGAVVTFTASATDLVDGAVTPNCTPASGTTFPTGTTTVSCTATDKAENTASGSFKVTVVGTTPPSTSAFSAFSVNPLRINQRLKTFFLLSSFTLGSGNNGIDPTKEPVALTIAGFTATIPAGSFRKGSGPFGMYAFAGKIDGVSIEMLITPLGNKRFGFQAAAYGVNPSVANNSVTVGLAIGNDSGTTSVKPVIIK